MQITINMEKLVHEVVTNTLMFCLDLDPEDPNIKKLFTASKKAVQSDENVQKMLKADHLLENAEAAARESLLADMEGQEKIKKAIKALPEYEKYLKAEKIRRMELRKKTKEQEIVHLTQLAKSLGYTICKIDK